MTIPLARIHHLEQAIRRRRRHAMRINSRRYVVTGGLAPELQKIYWRQLEVVTGLLQALHRSRSVYHHNAAKLETTKV